MSSYFVSIKTVTGEYKHFKVEKEVYDKIKQLEAKVKYSEYSAKKKNDWNILIEE
jgi:hypothetical protein